MNYDPYHPEMMEKYGAPGETDNEGFNPYTVKIHMYILFQPSINNSDIFFHPFLPSFLRSFHPSIQPTRIQLVRASTEEL